MYNFVIGLLATPYILIGMFVLASLLLNLDWPALAGVFMILVAVSLVLLFKASLLTMVIFALSYFVLGVLWSFWKYKRFIDNSVEQANNIKSNAYIKPPNAMWGTITGWILSWPFGLTSDFIFEFYSGIKFIARKMFSGVYEWIYENAISKLNKKEK